MSRHTTPRTRRPLPEWLIGLLLAIVVVIIGALILSALGAGDDPSFEGDVGGVGEPAAAVFVPDLYSAPPTPWSTHA